MLKSGRTMRTGGVSVRYTKAAGSKAAVIVGTKVARKASQRNYLRRKGYAALTKLPQGIYMAVFIVARDFDPRDIIHLCSKLS